MLKGTFPFLAALCFLVGSVSVAKGLAYLMPGAVGKGLLLGPERHGPRLIALLSSCMSGELPESNLKLPRP